MVASYRNKPFYIIKDEHGLRITHGSPKSWYNLYIYIYTNEYNCFLKIGTYGNREGKTPLYFSYSVCFIESWMVAYYGNKPFYIIKYEHGLRITHGSSKAWYDLDRGCLNWIPCISFPLVKLNTDVLYWNPWESMSTTTT